ncbi:TPA: restriction endonuclease subunit S [Streptococcus suis]|nr:restriction endonuclease subunit S [Streptococcus suis]
MTPEQLKASILQRAMEGKLVPQDPNDEPASELLKRIKEEKEKLISEGKVKRDKKETEFFCGDDGKPYEKLADGKVKKVEVPYEIPDSWEWVRLGKMITLISGRDLKRTEYVDGKIIGLPYLTGASNFQNGQIVTGRYTEKPSVISTKGELLITVKGTIGEMAFNPFEQAHIARQIMSIQSIYLNLNFLKYLLTLLLPGVKQQAQSMIPGVSRESLLSILIPLPPLAEQKRIVAQIEHALEKVEVYAESYNKLQELDRAFPDKLKKSILQYAMQGKLVAQDPNDEPVEVLLEKIRAEKQKLYEEGKLKKKDLAEIVTEKGDDNSPYKEVPYSIPESWTWVKLGDIGLWGAGATPSKSNIKYYEPQSIPWLLTGDLNDGYITNIPNKISELALEKTSVKLNPKGTVLIAMYGATIGKLGILTFPATTNQACCACNTLFEADKLFLFYFLMSERKKFTSRAEGGAQPNISKEKIVNTLFPLPPLAEQQRIVSKISQVFSVIESLV